MALFLLAREYVPRRAARAWQPVAAAVATSPFWSVAAAVAILPWLPDSLCLAYDYSHSMSHTQPPSPLRTLYMPSSLLATLHTNLCACHLHIPL